MDLLAHRHRIRFPKEISDSAQRARQFAVLRQEGPLCLSKSKGLLVRRQFFRLENLHRYVFFPGFHNPAFRRADLRVLVPAFNHGIVLLFLQNSLIVIFIFNSREAGSIVYFVSVFIIINPVQFCQDPVGLLDAGLHIRDPARTGQPFISEFFSFKGNAGILTAIIQDCVLDQEAVHFRQASSDQVVSAFLHAAGAGHALGGTAALIPVCPVFSIQGIVCSVLVLTG